MRGDSATDESSKSAHLRAPSSSDTGNSAETTSEWGDLEEEPPKLTKRERNAANRKAAVDLIDRAIRAVDDYHAGKPNRKRRADIVKLLQQAGENLW